MARKIRRKLRLFHGTENKRWDSSWKRKYSRMLLRRKIRLEISLTQRSSKNCFHVVMEPEITLGQVDGWTEGQNGGSKYRKFHQGLGLSHWLGMRGTEAKKVPWEEKGSLDQQLRVIKGTDGLKPVTKCKNWGNRLPLIWSGTSLPGWAILSSYHSLNLVEKYQIAVKKEKEQRETPPPRGQWSWEAGEKEVQIVPGAQAPYGRNCGSQEADHLAENEWVQGLGTSGEMKGMFRGNAMGSWKAEAVGEVDVLSVPQYLCGNPDLYALYSGQTIWLAFCLVPSQARNTESLMFPGSNLSQRLMGVSE